MHRIQTAFEVCSHLTRYREILRILTKHGFGEFLKLIHLQRFLNLTEGEGAEAGGVLSQKSTAERFRMALEELGPTFVKLGQILSTRRDLVDESMFNELRKLQDQVAPFPESEARAIIEEQLGRPLPELFEEFQGGPVASASIAQVHRAVLRDGQVVAVKVHRPNIRATIEVDLAILMDVARFLEKHVHEIAVLNPVGLVREFAKAMQAELDFTNEARNMERFANQFRSNHNIRVPRLHRELTTSRVLVMEFVAGCPVDRPDLLRAQHIDPIRLSERISKIVFLQMFRHGFFHGDPHPGNITILPGGVIALYVLCALANHAPRRFWKPSGTSAPSCATPTFRSWNHWNS